MVEYSLQLVVDHFPPKARLLLPSTLRAIYVREGSAMLRANHVAATLAANSAVQTSLGLEVIAGTEEVQCLRWELRIKSEAAHLNDQAQGIVSQVLLEETVQLDPAVGYLLRCDRVDFPPGGVAHLHTHQGPGIRCLLRGSLKVDTAGHTYNIAPGGAWFESGADPVLATASGNETTAFARVMILPAVLKGKSSIRYVRQEDLHKPKPQRYQVFIDEPIELATASA